MMNAVTFGDKNSFSDFNLILKEKEIELPKAKTEKVDVPGMDGSLDFTEFLSDEIKYENRKLTFTFTTIGKDGNFSGVVSKLTNFLHGKKMQVQMNWDRNFYYFGRCFVDKFKTNKRTSDIVVYVDADPYKLENHPHSDPWEWDDFSFIDGIIYVSTFDIETTKTVNLINRRKTVSPTFTCDHPMQIQINNKMFDLPIGVSKNLDIRLTEGDNLVTFIGTGRVNVEYVGGSL